jgi:magnesium-transporting ATPase (P-type)
LIINVLGDGIPGLALAKEQSDRRIMTRRPIGRDESFFSDGLMEVIIQQTVMCSLTVLSAFYIGKFVIIPGNFLPSHSIGQMMAFLVLGWTSLLHIFTVKSRISVFKRSMKDNLQLPISTGVMFLVLAGLVAIPPFASTLGFAVMGGYHWLITLGISLIPMLVAEYGKFWDSYRYREAERLRGKRQEIH